jgi:mycothione reductase
VISRLSAEDLRPLFCMIRGIRNRSMRSSNREGHQRWSTGCGGKRNGRGFFRSWPLHADAAECARAARRFGFETTVRTPDPDTILRDTFEFTNKYDGILENALGKNVTLYRNHAAFTANRTLQVNNNLISADRVVLATGSRPQRPALDVPYWTSDEVFTLKKMPKSITIVGGGYIACELGHFFHGVRVDTLIVVRSDQLLDREDAETRAVFMKGFTERVSVTFNSTIASVRYDGSRFHVGIAHVDGTHSNRDSEALLFCIGRLPNSDNIGIQNTDLKPNARGYVESDDHLRTPVEGVYAMGDIAGRYMFTHAANFESEYLAIKSQRTATRPSTTARCRTLSSRRPRSRASVQPRKT